MSIDESKAGVRDKVGEFGQDGVEGEHSAHFILLDQFGEDGASDRVDGHVEEPRGGREVQHRQVGAEGHDEVGGSGAEDREEEEDGVTEISGEEGDEEEIGEEGSEEVEDGQVGVLIQGDFILEFPEEEELMRRSNASELEHDEDEEEDQDERLAPGGMFLQQVEEREKNFLHNSTRPPHSKPLLPP